MFPKCQGLDSRLRGNDGGRLNIEPDRQDSIDAPPSRSMGFAHKIRLKTLNQRIAIKPERTMTISKQRSSENR